MTDIGERVTSVVATLRYFAWECEAYGEIADQIEREHAAGWEGCMCCPVCQEVTCDRGCPLRPVREP